VTGLLYAGKNGDRMVYWKFVERFYMRAKYGLPIVSMCAGLIIVGWGVIAFAQSALNDVYGRLIGSLAILFGGIFTLIMVGALVQMLLAHFQRRATSRRTDTTARTTLDTDIGQHHR